MLCATHILSVPTHAETHDLCDNDGTETAKEKPRRCPDLIVFGRLVPQNKMDMAQHVGRQLFSPVVP